MAKAKNTKITPQNFYQHYYGQLDGATIVRFMGMNEGDQYSCGAFPMFEVKDKDGKKFIIEISQDEEGNGGGFIFGLCNPYDL